MNTHGFTSALAPELAAYLAFKEKMGCYGNSRIWYLKLTPRGGGRRSRSSR